MNRLSLNLGFASALMLLAGQASAFASENLATHAKLTMGQAKAIALKAHPGVITDQELEREGGGLRFSFDIRNGHKTFEVGVDAVTGRVLENKAEGPNPD